MKSYNAFEKELYKSLFNTENETVTKQYKNRIYMICPTEENEFIQRVVTANNLKDILSLNNVLYTKRLFDCDVVIERDPYESNIMIKNYQREAKKIMVESNVDTITLKRSESVVEYTYVNNGDMLHLQLNAISKDAKTTNTIYRVSGIVYFANDFDDIAFVLHEDDLKKLMPQLKKSNMFAVNKLYRVWLSWYKNITKNNGITGVSDDFCKNVPRNFSFNSITDKFPLFQKKLVWYNQKYKNYYRNYFKYNYPNKEIMEKFLIQELSKPKYHGYEVLVNDGKGIFTTINKVAIYIKTDLGYIQETDTTSKEFQNIKTLVWKKINVLARLSHINAESYIYKELDRLKFMNN